MTDRSPLRNAFMVAPLLLTAAPVMAAVPTTGLPATTTPVCEPYVDRREARLQAGLIVVVGRVDPATIVEDRQEQPPVGQMLVTGTADIILNRSDKGTPAPPVSAGSRLKVNYAYWLPAGGCSGWQPARAIGDYVFRLAPQRAPDGSYRVALYTPNKPNSSLLVP